ncbi:hypothetical protein CON65_09465 [Bacillus pseudomycoides]|uniref:Uncharacterized protein n=1 Tax=Bacillus pseudomycoides TaxID=64104 RepID=A0AA91VCW0_9BACI|nr:MULTISPECIES: hypothetical protein [Bacillus]PEB48010.1 hypothetical protein COO03_24795 [Bacillus sp. AFS098217]PED82888.1 hypothetical protein CON65_09465 [Bacillus pseudomycoides]PEU09725.1 hypothetical protein CN524_17990 [Bacillus sp. AFS019443]PEU18420.1 hypothetical protein CN525_11790 [Bacillus sp. AFS014408]PFW62664.1 hypothetical protein COL20_12140 [Bacillus sp. AFS075034]
MEKETEEADILTEEVLMKHFGATEGFSRVSNSLVRLYTLLPGFNSDVVGLYAYMRSWRNTSNEDLLYTVWHSREYLQLQSGLGRKAFNTRLSVLVTYGLVETKKSPIVANKDYFIVHDPLERAEFLATYRQYVDEFLNKAAEIEARNKTDRERRYEKQRQRLYDDIRISHEAKKVPSVQKEHSDNDGLSIMDYL